ncbi:DUF1513 domain-containing protein [Photobacterium makurazakiensis]|uniref:DUF1513 domain-containing protein n=1 Tax=Photobacterium makurazakiensis TaxID=2910234 RepID=UPI003D0F2D50
MVTDQTRRKLLQGALGGIVLSPFASVLSGCSQPLQVTNASEKLNVVNSREAIIGCSRQPNGQFDVVVAKSNGMPIYQLNLPARGHGVAIQPNGTLAAAFSRRPGRYLQVFDYRTGERWPLKQADQDRHYYGHGVFSPDGQWLYATEGKAHTSEGVIGVYALNHEASTQPKLIKVAEFTGFGIGPHEVVLADQDTLAIGVGGVHTQGRTPLNLDTMQPALVYINRHTGELVDQAELADKRLSIRHLSVTESGDIACGQQYRGEPEDAVPLVALHRRGGPLNSLVAEDEEWQRFNHYIASIASLDGYLLATSPRGNCYGIWDEATRELVALNPLIDASGVDVLNGTWRVGSGSGKIASVSPPATSATYQSPIMWDNHWHIVGTNKKSS